MSAVIHYSDAPDGTIPKRFLCGKKPKGGNEWTGYPWIVECPRCGEAMRKMAKRHFAASSREENP